MLIMLENKLFKKIKNEHQTNLVSNDGIFQHYSKQLEKNKIMALFNVFLVNDFKIQSEITNTNRKFRIRLD
jgi:sRNA-binding regulator protein Hfq